MKSLSKNLFSLVIILAISICLFTILPGCGGGGSTGAVPGVTDDNTDDNTDDGTPEDTDPGTTLYPGTFRVTVKVPHGYGVVESSEDITGSIVPWGSRYLYVYIQTEATTGTDVEGTLDLGAGSPAGPHTMTINNVPPGLNIATIQLFDRDPTDPAAVLMAQRTHGFYMTSGGTVTAGSAAAPLQLGISIGDGGSTTCDPADIEIPINSVLSYENLDYASDHTISLDGGTITIGPILAADQSVQPDLEAVFYAESSPPFATRGIFAYDAGGGAPGNVTVYGPQLLSIVDGDGNDYDPDDASTLVQFTLTGQDFGPDQASVSGLVTFYDTATFTGQAATINTWSDTEITGEITIPGEKYFVEVTTRSINTTDLVYYFKGAGAYEVWVEKNK